MQTNFTERWIRKFRILTVSLMFSGALNIGLIATFIVRMLQEQSASFSYATPASCAQAAAPTNQKLLSQFAGMSFRELAALLTNNECVEEGYRKKDLALSALVCFHHFDVERALGGKPEQRRTVVLDGKDYELFPGLKDEQFQALLRFAYLEKWPLTPEGLFAYLQREKGSFDPTLVDAFCHTPEFYSFQALFQKCASPPSAEELLSLCAEGSWQMLEGFVLEQSQMLDLTEERRRRVLLSYLAHQSKTAARLLVKTDFSFALKRLDDKGILDLLAKISTLDDELRSFCVELLHSSRSDAVWSKSAELLYKSAGIEIPERFERAVALARFAPESSQKQTCHPAPKPAAQPVLTPKKTHLVLEGENLWKISRRYKVKLDEIVALNGLEKEQIYPGMLLQIP